MKLKIKSIMTIQAHPVRNISISRENWKKKFNWAYFKWTVNEASDSML